MFFEFVFEFFWFCCNLQNIWDIVSILCYMHIFKNCLGSVESRTRDMTDSNYLLVRSCKWTCAWLGENQWLSRFGEPDRVKTMFVRRRKIQKNWEEDDRIGWPDYDGKMGKQNSGNFMMDYENNNLDLVCVFRFQICMLRNLVRWRF